MSEDWSLQVSYKLPSGALINVRAGDADELSAMLVALTERAGQILATEQTLTAGGHLATALPLHPQQPQPPAAPLPAPPSPSSQAPVGYSPAQPGPLPQGPSGAASPSQWQPAGQPAGPVCHHGSPAKLVPAGVSKSTGRPYRGFYACAMDRANQCDFRQQA